MAEQYITIYPTPIVPVSDINTLGTEYGLPLSANLFGSGTTTGVYSVAANSTSGQIYVLSNGGSVLIYNSNRTLNRTVTGFLSNQTSIRFNSDETLYGCIRYAAGSSAALRVMTTSTDIQSYTVTLTGMVTFDFNPNNSNVFVCTLVGVISEYTNAGVLVGLPFTVTNVVRSRCVKRQPGTNRIWVSGDSGNDLLNRLSYFDATTRTVTNVTVPTAPVTGRQIGVITGMSFYGSRIFIHHSSARDSSTTAISKMITEISDTGTVIAQWPIFGYQTNYSDGCVYQGYTKPVILYSRLDNLTNDVVGTLILP
jgi:hypothetical protein